MTSQSETLSTRTRRIAGGILMEIGSDGEIIAVRHRIRGGQKKAGKAALELEGMTTGELGTESARAAGERPAAGPEVVITEQSAAEIIVEPPQGLV